MIKSNNVNTQRHRVVDIAYRGLRKHAHPARHPHLVCCDTHLRNTLLAFEKQHIDALLDGFTAAVHVVAKIGLGSRLGIEGVALGAFLGEAALLNPTIWMYRRVARSVRHSAAPPRTKNR